MPCVWCTREYGLVHWDRLPSYLKYNKYIDGDYRAEITFKQSLASMFHWHNETLNIWTHLCGFLIFAILIPLSLSTWLSDQEPLTIAFSILYFCSSMVVMSSSTIFHTFSCMSASMYNRLAKLDYLGIAVQIIGSFGFVCYFLFKCDPVAMTIYLLVVLLSGLAVIITTLLTNIHGASNVPQRLGVFIGFGFSLVLCAPHSIVIHGWAFFPLFWRLFSMGTMYMTGALLYGFQIPERWFPGKLNSYPSSHVLWHCFVLAGALIHYFTCFWLVHEKSFNKYCTM